ncbi:MAG: GntR family transcriptional regulator [bacterium]|uniref:Transcriptional regulator n=2 Tax=Bacteria candidate phyla TaxID=1783234 RepID=A0A101I379_UNCT6|nr:MAG: Transcriptional regulator [candidate division TA06 bacterium 32_111]KUK87931.1 MAG: Transcriptional regulator [candidate division TA06 bacterium 34_109]MDI6700540.1 GntR family transcriptional regulator [bacterium]HAF08084.1 GntR family transcriptional regulator [candidate division WOR-3 bacterium]HCP16215.1 GntR family transcriptional regulator [candidate division WOR-3 bacterium]
MNIIIDTESTIPVYQQIKNQIKGMIVSQELKKGIRLPSIRDLSKILNLSINTVAKAYYELEREGLLKLDGRRGSTILGLEKIDENERKNFLEKITEEFLLRSKEYSYSKDEIIKMVNIKYGEIY